ncbi:MAG TPA: DNA gyrase inhibitor YacG [Steroidobacteraceae bacterium]|nr:DNA gyrase inhibitor YacG [Steroidobacteraceae bacterium]
MSSIRVRCPTCRRELEWDAAPFRPFCSERCRLIDLGAWLSEQRVIPGEAGPAADAEPTPGDEPQRGPS